MAFFGIPRFGATEYRIVSVAQHNIWGSFERISGTIPFQSAVEIGFRTAGFAVTDEAARHAPPATLADSMIDRLSGMPAFLAAITSIMLATSAFAGIPLGISIPPAKANALDFARFTKNTDITPRLVEISANFPPEPSTISLPDTEIQAIREIGALPLITWMLPDSLLDDAWTTSLRELAQAVRADGGKIWMRLAVPRREEPSHAASYRDTFRRVAGIFRDAGADNVGWMFVVDLGRSDAPEAALDADAFPGNDVVDVIGLRALNWGDTQRRPVSDRDSDWQSFRDLFEPVRAEWQERAPDKTIVAITATASTGGKKSDWVLDAVRTAAEWRLAALIWFQHKGAIDWAIQESIPREIMMEAQTLNTPLSK